MSIKWALNEQKRRDNSDQGFHLGLAHMFMVYELYGNYSTEKYNEKYNCWKQKICICFFPVDHT